MFNGKVKFTKFINGKPYFFERHFDDQNEFDKFLSEHQNDFELLPNYDVPNFMGVYDPISIMNQVNNLVDRHINSKLGNKSSDPVIDKYEKEIQKIEHQKQQEKLALENREKEVTKKKELINKLIDYKAKFESENRQDLIDQVNEDIARLQKEIE